MPELPMKPCDSNPFIKLGDASKAPILDYSIPQKSCMPIYSAMPVFFPEKYFREEYLKAAADPFWTGLKDKSVKNIKRLLKLELAAGTDSQFIENFHLIVDSSVPIMFLEEAGQTDTARATYIDAKGSAVAVAAIKGDMLGIRHEAHTPVEATPAPELKSLRATGAEVAKATMTDIAKVEIKASSRLAVEVNIDELAEKLAEGMKAICISRPDGKLSFRFRPRERKKLFPALYVKLELQQCSFLGDYGAGDTVSTFSLLPGEKTTISINSYRNSTILQSRSHNILDSMSESSLNSFEKELQTQEGEQSSTSSSSGVTNPGKVTTNGTGLIPALFWNHKKTVSKPTTTASCASHVTKVKSSVENSLSKTVSQSNHFRDVNINFSSESQVEEGESEHIYRQLENVNLSRTLNFVVRRLVQKHTVVLWLDNVKFGFYNGATTDEISSEDLVDFIKTYMVDDVHEEVMRNLLRQVTHVFNHKQDPVQFLECVDLELPPVECDCSEIDVGGEKFCFWRKKSDLSDTYGDITVPGIILNVDEYVLRTPSVIVDSLLGQGEALDCYNTRLQDQNIRSQVLNNRRMSQAIKVIDSFDTAAEKAENYKSVFGDCCPEK